MGGIINHHNRFLGPWESPPEDSVFIQERNVLWVFLSFKRMLLFLDQSRTFAGWTENNGFISRLEFSTKRKNSSLEMKPLFRVHPSECGIGLLNLEFNFVTQLTRRLLNLSWVRCSHRLPIFLYTLALDDYGGPLFLFNDRVQVLSRHVKIILRFCLEQLKFGNVKKWKGPF